MPRQRKCTMQNGEGIFQNLGKALMTAGKFVKKHKLVSTGLSLIPDKRAQKASEIAKAVGLGRKPRRRRMTGRGLTPSGSGLKIAGAGRRRKRATRKVVYP